MHPYCEIDLTTHRTTYRAISTMELYLAPNLLGLLKDVYIYITFC